MTIQKPFLKWAGGKNKLLEHIIPHIPAEIENYHEIFLGGGSVLLAVLSLQKQNEITIKNKIYAYDLNKSLINCFKQVQKNYEKVYYLVNALKQVFHSIEENTLLDEEGKIVKGSPNVDETNFMSTREHYYYWIRHLFNTTSKTTQKSAAYFIFLNKTGFKGMYRENKSGKFDIPYGLKDKEKKKKIKWEVGIIDKNEIKKISDLIQNVKFVCKDFEKSLKKVKKSDFVYLDPPYAPENQNSFVKYNKDGFGLDMHKSLFKQVHDLNKKNIKFVMSNSDVDLVNKEFSEYKVKYIMRRNAIHSKKPRTKAKEIIIYN